MDVFVNGNIPIVFTNIWVCKWKPTNEKKCISCRNYCWQTKYRVV